MKKSNTITNNFFTITKTNFGSGEKENTIIHISVVNPITANDFELKIEKESDELFNDNIPHKFFVEVSCDFTKELNEALEILSKDTSEGYIKNNGAYSSFFEYISKHKTYYSEGIKYNGCKNDAQKLSKAQKEYGEWLIKCKSNYTKRKEVIADSFNKDIKNHIYDFNKKYHETINGIFSLVDNWKAEWSENKSLVSDSEELNKINNEIKLLKAKRNSLEHSITKTKNTVVLNYMKKENWDFSDDEDSCENKISNEVIKVIEEKLIRGTLPKEEVKGEIFYGFSHGLFDFD